MPRISEFFGIFIYMYFDDVQQHHEPHIHAYYGEYRAVFSIRDGHVLAGRMRSKQQRRVQDWIEARKAALNENWERAQRSEELLWIAPL